MEDSSANSLFHGFSGSSQYLNSSHAALSMEHQSILSSPNHRKSRKHQRFIKHKALLQQNRSKDILKDRDKWPVTAVPRHVSCLQSCEQISDCQVNNPSTNLDDIKALLGTLPAMSYCSSANLHHLSLLDYDSGLSMPGSCASSRPSSPVSCLKPGKCVAIDCEMVGTGPGGRISELARCSVVNYRGDIVYDKYIKPELPITDYRTKWSGITKRNMKNAIPFKTAQKEIVKILKDKRVVGHALHNDFKALKYFHPSAHTRDTSKMFLLNQKAGLPLKSSASLRSLAWHLLHKKIQVCKKGHSSVEDAQTSMELYKLVEDEWEQDQICYQVSSSDSSVMDSVSDNDHYMDDQYWPPDLTEDC
ncbi:apoptosis-enhancing nuclease-like [Discoglossus pictus]